jgi:hypothetical protein
MLTIIVVLLGVIVALLAVILMRIVAFGRAINGNLCLILGAKKFL